METSLSTTDALALVDSWVVALRADRKTPGTITAYLKGVDQFGRWCVDTGAPMLDRHSLRTWSVERLDDGIAPATVRARQVGIRSFSAWLLDEGEITADPFVGFRPPKVDTPVVDPFTEDELRALLAACQAPRTAPYDERLRARRDEAMLRLLFETGCRSFELLSLTLDDLDLTSGTAIVRRGKGGRGRIVPFGPKSTQALDRYVRLRRQHPQAEATSALWLGDRGRGPLAYGGLHYALNARATAAGVEGFHPHRLRHTAAHRWLSAGGTESGLQAVAGWSSPAMLSRYTRARASERAAQESRRLNLGDL